MPSAVIHLPEPQLDALRAAYRKAVLEKRVKPFTKVVSLDFEDHPFERTKFNSACAFCGATASFLDEVVTDDQGGRMFVCSDTDYCDKRQAANKKDAAE